MRNPQEATYQKGQTVSFECNEEMVEAVIRRVQTYGYTVEREDGTLTDIHHINCTLVEETEPIAAAEPDPKEQGKGSTEPANEDSKPIATELTRDDIDNFKEKFEEPLGSQEEANTDLDESKGDAPVAEEQKEPVTEPNQEENKDVPGEATEGVSGQAGGDVQSEGENVHGDSAEGVQDGGAGAGTGGGVSGEQDGSDRGAA